MYSFNEIIEKYPYLGKLYGFVITEYFNMEIDRMTQIDEFVENEFLAMGWNPDFDNYRTRKNIAFSYIGELYND